MKVKLIQTTQNPIDVMWTAARTCYASESPIDMWDKRYNLPEDYTEEALVDAMVNQNNSSWKLVQQVLNSGHLSIAEHVTFTFAIEGISRACSHQLVRHRHCTFSQQSQRYVEFEDGEFTAIVPPSFGPDDETRKVFNETMEMLSTAYAKLLELGAKPEDARSILPNACATNISFTCNFRELMHICNERLCTRAQTEIRQLTKLMVEEVKKQDGRLSQYLVPKCEIDGFCKEHKCCGRKPTLKSIKEQL